MHFRSIPAAGLRAGGTAGALAASQTAPPPDAMAGHGKHHEGMHHGGMRFSVEHVAMHNIMAELISQKTGRSVAEVRGLFENGDPRAAFDKLGLSRDDVHAMMKTAHGQLIDKAAAAGLITADQAATLHAAPIPEHPGHDGPPPGE